MKSILSCIFTLSLLLGASEAITFYAYSDAACTTQLSAPQTYTLNVCKDISSGGMAGSMKVTVCNATHASVNTYMGSASCSGAPSSTMTEYVNTCFNDGQGAYGKVSCTDAIPPPTVKSSATSVVVSFAAVVLGIGALFI